LDGVGEWWSGFAEGIRITNQAIQDDLITISPSWEGTLYNGPQKLDITLRGKIRTRREVHDDETTEIQSRIRFLGFKNSCPMTF
jgi:hypothetical protein